MPSVAPLSRRALALAITVAALGYFVDIYDLILFSIVRVRSLTDIGVPQAQIFSTGVMLLNMQMTGMLIGGLLWGVLGDKRGRLSVLFGTIVLYSAANLLNAAVSTVPQYAILRFIAGIGLAGELGAGITLVKGDLRGIARARRLSSATIRNIKQNLFFAFVYNGLGVPVAAGILYPWFGILLSPVFAAAAMSLSSVSVIANALRLRRVEL